MTKEELKKEAQEQVNCCTPLYPESFIQGYLAGAEPRENKIADIKANCDLAIEVRDLENNLEIKELKETDEYIIQTLENKVKKLQEDLRNKRISIKNKKAKKKNLSWN